MEIYCQNINSWNRNVKYIKKLVNLFFEEVNKIDKLLDKLTKIIDKTQLNKIRNVKGGITKNFN